MLSRPASYRGVIAAIRLLCFLALTTTTLRDSLSLNSLVLCGYGGKLNSFVTAAFVIKIIFLKIFFNGAI
jgi:hypothetical protein